MTDVVPAFPAIATLALESDAAPGGILIVDDHDLVRLGFRALVQSHAAPGPPPPVFEARNLTEALALYAGHAAEIGVVLLDLALPDTRGLSGVTEFRRRFPSARIVVLSGTTNPALAEGALSLGASAFLPKSADLSEVLHYIQRGGLFASVGIDRVPARITAASHATAGAIRELTQRQLQIMDWILAGKSNREISQLAEVTEGTVKNHVSTILLVFGLRSRAQLISSLR